MRVFLSILLIAMLPACGGCRVRSERVLYRLACRALQEAPGLPDSSVPARLADARISVGKSAAWVELPYTYNSADGSEAKAIEVIWFKRVARTWTVDRIQPRTASAPAE